MIRLKNIFLAVIVSAGLSFQATAADYVDDYNERPGMGMMAADGLLVRPLTLGVAAVGFVGWVVTLPFLFLEVTLARWAKPGFRTLSNIRSWRP